MFPSQIKKILRVHTKKSADATFTLEEGDSPKRVKIRDGRIVASSANANDPILVYNMAMRPTFLDKLYNTVKNKKDKAFAFAMNDLARNHKIYVADVSFININRPEDILKAERMLKQHKT